MTLDRILRAIARGEPWRRRGQEPGQLHQPLVSNRCQMALTYGPNHKRIKVRCRCMAEYRTRPNYFVYDYLAIVDSLTEAWEVWEYHRRRIMAVTAKITCNLKQEYTDGSGNKAATVGFVADYADERNKEWALYTPLLDLRMSLKGDVADKFHLGGYYTLVFEEE